MIKRASKACIWLNLIDNIITTPLSKYKNNNNQPHQITENYLSTAFNFTWLMSFSIAVMSKIFEFFAGIAVGFDVFLKQRIE